MNIKRIKRLAGLAYRSIVVGNRTQRQHFIATHLHGNPRYADPLRLNRQEFRAFSQGGEDGILAEIFRRIGTTGRTFCEIGLEDGLECNTRLLLNQGWTGLWIEGSPRCGPLIRQHFAEALSAGRLHLENH
ncbi:MAG: hypothetical protein JWO94_2596, partial [Verrucomicrobiaceae bacterium]|nr:hypothetical protein [Verrucomicrobiaceae bacterium]